MHSNRQAPVTNVFAGQCGKAPWPKMAGLGKDDSTFYIITGPAFHWPAVQLCLKAGLNSASAVTQCRVYNLQAFKRLTYANAQ